MTIRVMTLEIVVRVPHTVGEGQVENAINEALDEPPCDWENWEVGAARITNVTHEEDDDEEDDEEDES